MKYKTMTAGGSRGSDIEAADDDEAMFKADQAGHVVLDITWDRDGSLILVIAE